MNLKTVLYSIAFAACLLFGTATTSFAQICQPCNEPVIIIFDNNEELGAIAVAATTNGDQICYYGTNCGPAPAYTFANPGCASGETQVPAYTYQHGWGYSYVADVCVNLSQSLSAQAHGPSVPPDPWDGVRLVAAAYSAVSR